MVPKNNFIQKKALVRKLKTDAMLTFKKIIIKYTPYYIPYTIAICESNQFNKLFFFLFQETLNFRSSYLTQDTNIESACYKLKTLNTGFLF